MHSVIPSTCAGGPPACTWDATELSAAEVFRGIHPNSSGRQVSDASLYQPVGSRSDGHSTGRSDRQTAPGNGIVSRDDAGSSCLAQAAVYAETSQRTSTANITIGGMSGHGEEIGASVQSSAASHQQEAGADEDASNYRSEGPQEMGSEELNDGDDALGGINVLMIDEEDEMGWTVGLVPDEGHDSGNGISSNGNCSTRNNAWDSSTGAYSACSISIGCSGSDNISGGTVPDSELGPASTDYCLNSLAAICHVLGEFTRI